MCNICNWKAVYEYDLKLILLSFVHSTANFLLRELCIVVGVQGAIYYDSLPRIFHAFEYSIRLGYISGQICSETKVKGVELQLFFSPTPTQIRASRLQLSEQRTRLMEDFGGDERHRVLLSTATIIILLRSTSRPWEDSLEVVQAQHQCLGTRRHQGGRGKGWQAASLSPLGMRGGTRLTSAAPSLSLDHTLFPRWCTDLISDKREWRL